MHDVGVLICWSDSSDVVDLFFLIRLFLFWGIVFHHSAILVVTAKYDVSANVEPLNNDERVIFSIFWKTRLATSISQNPMEIGFHLRISFYKGFPLMGISNKWVPFMRDFPLYEISLDKGFSFTRDFLVKGIPLYQGFHLFSDFPLQGISLHKGIPFTRDSLYQGFHFIREFPL